MSALVKSIQRSFSNAYPDNEVYVCKYKAPGGASLYYGEQLALVELSDKEWLVMYKLDASAGRNVDNEEIKRAALPLIQDTKDVTNGEQRIDAIKAHLKPLYPNHYINVFIYGSNWSSAFTGKGSATFMNDYGSDVCIVLN